MPQPRASFTPPHGQHSGAFPLPAPEAEVPWPPPHLQNGHPQPGQRPVDGAPSEATAVIPVITPDTTAVIAAIPADAAPPTAEIGPLTVPGPVAGGRAARRRAQEAAAAVAREATRDPETVAFVVDDKLVEPGAPRSEPQEQEESLASTVGGRGFRLRDIPPVWLVGAGVGLLIAIAAILATAVASNGAPASAALNPPGTTSAAAAPAGNQEAAAPRQSETDPTSPKAVAYLTALRNADITTSKTGQPETEAAAVLCEQIGQGADENELVKALPAVLPTVTKKQAPDVVRLAKKHYC